MLITRPLVQPPGTGVIGSCYHRLL